MGEGKTVGLRLRTASKRTRLLAFLLVAATVAAAVWASTNYAMQAIKTSWNDRRLAELVENVILRAEFAIDNVILTKVDLLSAGHSTCSPEAITSVREAIYRNGTLVDIKISTPEGNCQAFEEIGLDQDTIIAAKDRAIAARNSAFSFMPLTDEQSLGLGVVWEFQPDHVMTAIIRTDGLLFDMLPAGIRDSAGLRLSLDDGAVIARYERSMLPNSIAPEPGTQMFSASSDRYPLYAELAVPAATFNGWHDPASPLTWFVTTLTSLALGLLIAMALVRAPSERERLQTAIRSGEITPYFQPIISLSNNRVVGCEVLARWIKSDGSQVSPGIFIPLAELTDQTDAITRSLMIQTGRDLQGVIASNPCFKINFNLTAKQLAAPNFTAGFLAFAKKCGLPKKQLVAELIERESLDTMGDAKTALTELQDQGVRVAIDDVGTGQNGLALLQSLNADILKIDKLFVDLIDEDESSRAISQMLVSIAESSNMSLVAEGIERKEQADTLREMGITEAQGFYFARPLPAKEFVTFVSTNLDMISAEQDLILDIAPQGKSLKPASEQKAA